MKDRLKAILDKKTIIGIIIVMVIAIALPFLIVKVIQPAINNANKSKIANNAIVSTGHKWSKSKSVDADIKSADVNSTQYIMTSNNGQSCYAFKGQSSSPSNKVKVVLAFGDSKSRDWASQQFSALEHGMKKGTISVDVCPLLTDDAYSSLAMEALAEIDYNNPNNGWQAISKLLMVDSSSLTTTKARTDAITKVVDSIPNADNKVGISDTSLRAGSFAMWSKMMTAQNHTERIPAMFVNGTNMTNSNLFNFNDPDSFYSYIDSLESK